MTNLFANVCFVARSKSGKTTALKRVLPKFEGFYRVLMSNVERFDPEHGRGVFNEKLAYDDAGWERLRVLINTQQEIVRRGHRKNKLLVVLDDAIADNYRPRYVAECLSQCRHYNTKFIIFTQHITSTLSPAARANIHVWMVGQVSRETLEYIYPATNFNDRASMWDAYQDTTKKYHFWRLNSANLPDEPRVVSSAAIGLEDICE